MATIKKVKKYQYGGISEGTKTLQTNSKSLNYKKPVSKVVTKPNTVPKSSSASDKYTRAIVSGTPIPGPRMKKGGKIVKKKK